MEITGFTIGATLCTFLFHWFIAALLGMPLKQLYKFYFDDEVRGSYFLLISAVVWGIFMVLIAGIYNSIG